MSDEQPQKKAEGSQILQGLSVQLLGGAIAGMWMLHQKQKGVFYEAAYESYLGTLITASFYGLYWLLKPRIMKWRKG